MVWSSSADKITTRIESMFLWRVKTFVKSLGVFIDPPGFSKTVSNIKNLLKELPYVKSAYWGLTLSPFIFCNGVLKCLL